MAESWASASVQRTGAVLADWTVVELAVCGAEPTASIQAVCSGVLKEEPRVGATARCLAGC